MQCIQLVSAQVHISSAPLLSISYNNPIKTELGFPSSLVSSPVLTSSLGPLLCNVLRDGLRIQEVAPAVSIVTLRSAPQGRRPLLKHKELRGLDKHKQPRLHTLNKQTLAHTNPGEHTRTWSAFS